MRFFPRRARYPRQKPRYPQLNPQHPAVARLEHLWAFDRMGGKSASGTTNALIHDLRHTAHFALGSNAGALIWGYRIPGGVYLSNNDVDIPVATMAYIPPPFTILCVFQGVTGAGGQSIYTHDSGANNGYRINVTGGNIRLTFGSVADYTGIAYSLNVWYVFVCTVTANNGTAVYHMRPLGGGAYSTLSQAVGTVAGTPTRSAISSSSTCDIALIAHWSRVLGTSEVMTLLTKPWTLIAPSTLTMGVNTAGGATFNALWV